MNATEPPRLSCVFCEDIRQEVTGLASFIGVMPASINLDLFPITLPKLSVSVSFYFPNYELPETLLFRLMAPWQEEPIITLPIDITDTRQDTANMPDPDSLGLWASCCFALPSFPIPSPGRILAEANFGSGWIVAGTLRFKESPQPQ